jgi:hypothetical protein
MADARAVFPFGNAALSRSWGSTDIAMIEILFVYQLVRKPLEALARRWYCRSPFCASQGRRQCPGCTDS